MIEVLCQDITRLECEAIVNAANTSLLGGGGVDGAIHRAAGPELAQACRVLNGCQTGDAVITPGFNLLAKYVIHTVGPVWRGGNHGESDLLESCYRKSFALAKSKNVGSIAFPCISTGIYAYPPELAVEIALAVMTEYESEFDRITACCFSEADVMLYSRELRR